MKNIKKWDIYFAKLEGNGSVERGNRPVMVELGDNEPGVESKRRPCLVVANSEKSLTSIVLPITSKQNHSWYRTHVSVGKESGLLKDSQILCEQIKTIAKTKIGKKVAEVKDVHIQEQINAAMEFTLGI